MKIFRFTKVLDNYTGATMIEYSLLVALLSLALLVSVGFVSHGVKNTFQVVGMISASAANPGDGDVDVPPPPPP